MLGVINILRLLFRLLGAFFVALGLGAAAALAAVVFFPGGRATQPLGQVWFQFDLESLNLTQAIVQRRINPALWDQGIVKILGWPAWQGLLVVSAGLLIIGLVIIVMTRRRR